MACFNRKKKTFRSIQKIYQQTSFKDYFIDIYLTDDNSNDGTSEYIKIKFANVKIFKGNGNLYWGGGTNHSFKKAILSKIKYDFYLLLNDDTFLFYNSLKTLINAEKYIKSKTFISVGSTVNSKNVKSYGGMINHGFLIQKFKNISIKPTNDYQKINRFNGNIVLITSSAQKKIGILNNNLHHYLGDIEYGIRAEKKNIPIILCPGYQGICNDDIKVINFKDFFLGKKIFYSSFIFCYKYGGILWVLHFLSSLYSYLKQVHLFKFYFKK